MKKLLLLLPLAFAASANAQQVSPGTAMIFHPGYEVNNWYVPAWYGQAAASPAANGQNTVNCSFGSVLQTLTISTLGARIQTANSGTNLQLAVYNNGSWGRPGTLVVATGNISTTSTGAVNAAASASLPAGNYWFCSNADNAVVAISSQGTAALGPAQALVGTATQGSAGTGPAALATGISVAQAFNTWPTFASNTAWADVVSAIAPIINFKVASVP